jgi:hypothetical protein
MRGVVKEVSLAEKKELVEDILSSNPFLIRGKAVRGQRAREILAYLFRRYREDPSVRIAERDIFRDVFGEHLDCDRTVVRTAVVRLRRLLERYFNGRGARKFVRLTIPKGGYCLEFKRVAVKRNVFDWFWGPYLNKEQRVAFGVVPCPYHDRHPLPYVRAYSRFAEMMSDHAIDLEVLPNVLRPPFFSDAGSYGDSLMMLFIGGDDALVGDGHSIYGPEHKSLRFLSTRPFKMFRDPLGHTSISRGGQPPSGKAATLLDDDKAKHVLFTRTVVVKHCTTISLLMARNLDSCVTVADFLTSPKGLQILASHPGFKYGQLFAAPLELQIIFSTASEVSDDHCFSSTVGEVFKHLGIVECSYEFESFEQGEGDDD